MNNKSQANGESGKVKPLSFSLKNRHIKTFRVYMNLVFVVMLLHNLTNNAKFYSNN